jgi:hypothetical protein
MRVDPVRGAAVMGANCFAGAPEYVDLALIRPGHHSPQEIQQTAIAAAQNG